MYGLSGPFSWRLNMPQAIETAPQSVHNHSNGTTTADDSSPSGTASTSAASAASTTAVVQTRSIGYHAGVLLERTQNGPPSDNDIIVVTVRVARRRKTNSGASVNELPERPPARGFFRRVSTRLSSTTQDEDSVKVIKMPRRDYKRFFARDAQGQYVGTEPLRDWSEIDLQREFGAYQDVPLIKIVV